MQISSACSPLFQPANIGQQVNLFFLRINESEAGRIGGECQQANANLMVDMMKNWSGLCTVYLDLWMRAWQQLTEKGCAPDISKISRLSYWHRHAKKNYDVWFTMLWQLLHVTVSFPPQLFYFLLFHEKLSQMSHFTYKLSEYMEYSIFQLVVR